MIASIKRTLSSIGRGFRNFWRYELDSRPRTPLMQVGKLQPKGTALAKIAPVAVKERELCDACHATDAKYKASHETHSPLYLCSHHFHKHRIYLLMHHYEVKEL